MDFLSEVGLVLDRALERERIGKVAGREVARTVFFPFRRVVLTDLLGKWTARVKMTAARRVRRTRNFTFEHDRLHYIVRVQGGDGGHERLSVGMQRLVE